MIITFFLIRRYSKWQGKERNIKPSQYSQVDKEKKEILKYFGLNKKCKYQDTTMEKLSTQVNDFKVQDQNKF